MWYNISDGVIPNFVAEKAGGKFMYKRIVNILVVVSLVLSCITLALTLQMRNTNAINQQLLEILKEEKVTGTQQGGTGTTENQQDGTETAGIQQEVTETTGETIPEATIVEQKATFFSSNEMEYSIEYMAGGEVMPYALYKLTTGDFEEKMPLIVWLHGSGEINSSEKAFLNAGLPKVLNNWQGEGFNAYVVCPHLRGDWNTGRWNTEEAKENLQKLLEKFIAEHNVDTDNIIIIGHSLGGQGSLYMAHELSTYFSRCVVLSGYWPGTENSEIAIPAVGYVGTTSAGEDESSINYMQTYFEPVFGTENFFSIQASHGDVPKIAFGFDRNQNNRSDLLEWMFGELETISKG